MADAQITLALAGNPNTGKSTVFNALTGLQQHVANWPGKTVEKKAGLCTRANGVEITVVDLPGTYSLSAYSPEEVIARDYILQEQPQVVVNVVDALNLERNLYLTVQLLELGANLVLAVNMLDMADAAGLQFDRARLSALLGGVPVVPLIAPRGSGLDELLSTVLAAGPAARSPRRSLRPALGAATATPLYPGATRGRRPYRPVRAGSSASAVPIPTATASAPARIRCTCFRAASPVSHRWLRSPGARAPSRATASLRVMKGRDAT